MKPRHVTCFSVFVLGLLSAGCASVAGPAERAPQADKIAVYESVPPGSRPFRLVKRIWPGSWKSAIVVPRYRSSADGAADLQNQAVALGGDAIMYFGCYRYDVDAQDASDADLICNGNVIQYVQ